MQTNRKLAACLLADVIATRLPQREDRNVFSAMMVRMLEIGAPQDPHAYVREHIVPTIHWEREILQKMRLMFLVRRTPPSPWFQRQDLIKLIVIYDDDFLSDVFENLGSEFSQLWGPWYENRAKRT